MNIFIKYIALFLAVITVTSLTAQINTTNSYESDLDTLVSKSDSTPVIARLIKWQLHPLHNYRQYTAVDTTCQYIHHYSPIHQNTTSAGWLGNEGQAAYSNAYFENIYDDYANIFTNPYQLYYKDIDEQSYYNTTRPFSMLSYFQGPDELKGVKIFHTQNVKKDFNFGGKLNYWESQGPYIYQRANSHNLHAFFNYDGLRYNIYGAYSFSYIRSQDLEGINNDSLILKSRGYSEEEISANTSGSNRGRTEEIDVLSQIRRNKLFVRQEWNLGHPYPIIDSARIGQKPFKRSIGHIYKFEKSERLYEDKNVDSIFSFYYYDTAASKDFAKQWNITNELFLKNAFSFNSYSTFALQADYGYKYSRYLYRDVFWTHPETQDYSQYAAAHAYIVLKNTLESGVYSRYTFSGREKNDMLSNVFIKKDFNILKDSIRIFASLNNSLHEPSFFLENYASNNYYWKKNFEKENKLTAKFSLESLNKRFLIELQARLISDYLYISQAGTPNQYNEEVMVWAVKLQKLTKLWKFYMDNKIVLQQSDNQQILPLPDYVTYNSLYYRDIVFGEKLDLMVGAEMWFTKKYYAPAYNYPTGLFTLQNEKQIGEYPFVDFFVNLKFKRMRAFAKYSHLSYHFVEGDYFTIPHYPMNRNMFVFGLNWHFYN